MGWGFSLEVHLQIPLFVTPAKAGGHHPPMKFSMPVMDSRLRGNDEVYDWVQFTIRMLVVAKNGEKPNDRHGRG